MISLESLDPSRPVALLLRHAERPDILPGASGHNLSITADGASQASFLGQQLGPHLRSVRSSPVPRCVQTAQAILSGSHCHLPLQLDTLLGDPGPFVNDPQLGWQSFQKFGQDEVFRFVVEGHGEIPGFANPLVGAQTLLSHLLGTLGADPGFYVYVSHDLVLAGFLARLFHLPMLDQNWPGFLETVAIWQDNLHSIQIAFRRHRLAYSLASNLPFNN